MSVESPLRDRSSTTEMTPAFQLIETLRYEPDTDFLRLDLHLERLENSARALGFPFDINAVRQQLAAKGQGVKALRVRLTLDPEGVIDIETSSYEALPANTIWRLGIAKTRLRHDDPLLKHKTTRRELYVAAREEFSRDEVDEVLLFNDLEQLCEGTITTVFLDKGDKVCVTPDICCGLLSGILREELLRKKIVSEAVLGLDDVLNAHHIFVGNSLRGMIKADLSSRFVRL
ncbi:aminotransferase class IV family protein [Paenochrobactrum sp. BZR 588]|uniref:aminotransferase class IV family protein n=1 Tax=Paenochrobactrum TaxID=999488 RepID=UPI0035BC5B1A